MSNTLILSIETSCDETAIAILSSSKNGIEILTNQVSSQVKLHAKWGGVVPNLAAREHLKNFPRLLEMALEEAKILPSQLDAIALTNGPGLIPALLVGTNYAKTLSYLWEKPLIGIHHIEGHIYANFISHNMEHGTWNKNAKCKKINKKTNSLIGNSLNIKFPILCLVVSGGHTQLVYMKDHLQYEIIGQTLDDAVGEAFDKVARILGIGYPGGPMIAKWATKFQKSNYKQNTNDDRLLMTDDKNSPQKTYGIKFPRPMLNKSNFNFSFSGLKTAVLYETKKFAMDFPGGSTSIKEVEPPRTFSKKYIAEVCHEFQQACVDVLISKTLKAADIYKPKTIMLAGGVSANKELREQLGNSIKKNLPKTFYSIPDLSFTGDNAAMIGAAAAFRWQKMTDVQKKKSKKNWSTIQANANLKMK